MTVKRVLAAACLAALAYLAAAAAAAWFQLDIRLGGKPVYDAGESRGQPDV